MFIVSKKEDGQLIAFNLAAFSQLNSEAVGFV